MQPPLATPAAPPVDRPVRRRWSTLGGTAATIGVVLLKLKGALTVGLLSLKLLGPLVGIGASLLVYALFYGWRLAPIVLGLIAIHEAGHYVVIRAYGMPAALPRFIPGLGAYVAPLAPFPTPRHAVIAALAGPGTGTLGALLCYLYGVSNGQGLWFAGAHIGFLLGALNLLPLPILDGGKIAEALSPRLWIAGVVALLIWAFAMAHLSGPGLGIVIALALVSIPQALSAWRGREATSPSSSIGFGARAAILASTALLFAGNVIGIIMTPPPST